MWKVAKFAKFHVNELPGGFPLSVHPEEKMIIFNNEKSSSHPLCTSSLLLFYSAEFVLCVLLPVTHSITGTRTSNGCKLLFVPC